MVAYCRSQCNIQTYFTHGDNLLTFCRPRYNCSLKIHRYRYQYF